MLNTQKAEKALSSNLVLVVSCITIFVVPFILSSMNVILPSIQKEFMINAVWLGWFMNANLLATGISMVPAGRIADIYGHKKLIILGISLFLFSNLSIIFVSSFLGIIFLLAVQGIGSAIIITICPAIITAAFPLEERGKAIGTMMAVISLGFCSGPIMCGFLTAHFGWRSLFLLVTIMAAIAVIFVTCGIDNDINHPKTGPLDHVGGLLYSLSMVSFIIGFSTFMEMFGIGLIITGCMGFFIFTVYEIKCTNPMFDVKFFYSNRIFILACVITLVVLGEILTVPYLLSLYLQNISHLSAGATGMILIIQPLVSVIISLIAGRLSDRSGPAIVMASGVGFTIVGLLVLLFLKSTNAFFVIYTALFLLGVGFGLFSTPSMTIVLNSVSAEHHGVSSGIFTTMRYIGQILCVATVSIVFTYAGDKSMTHDGLFMISTKSIFFIFIFLCLICLFLSVFIVKKRFN